MRTMTATRHHATISTRAVAPRHRRPRPSTGARILLRSAWYSRRAPVLEGFRRAA